MSIPSSPNPTAPALVDAADLTKRYGAVQALRGVRLTVRSGEVHGLCGHNGAGKSTLVKMLVGLEHPDSGDLLVGGEAVTMHGVQAAQRHGIAMLDQELSLVPELTVAENIFLGNVEESRIVRRADRSRRARELLDTVGLHDMPTSRLIADTSLGERQLIEVARLLGRNAKVLILDEPTATLTDAEIEHVFAAVRSVVAQGAGVIFVSHRLDEVLDICDRVTVLRDGQTVAEQTVDTLTKNDLVTLMLGDLPPETSSEAPGFGTADDPLAGVEPGTGLSIKSLTVGTRVRGVDLEVPAGMIVGVAGQLGAGASEILSAISGLEPEVSGSVSVTDTRVQLANPLSSRTAGVHYVSNDRKATGLFISSTIESNLVATRLKAISSAGVLRMSRFRRSARELAELVGIDIRRLALPVGSLSGGNQQKVLVGRCLERPDLKVLLLDEPTRGVDVGGRAEIHRLIRHAAAQGVAVLFASTELDEVLDLADVVVTLYSGQVVAIRRRADTTLTEVFSDMTHRTTTEVA
ncbi:ATP-binding cassette domain-containing protein [Gordonia sp. HNM0687]|uniref:ATP-binding cassette domain-containing protein n=1 Tax=Gordonia mangrovi TaxID=2665643 RepID=A0A6L7GPD2_9ACTN|nr:sugar ABC transporter ATP-binding protein [Gordonia mangrovi]MXP21784.1 ATP-binding cassette domain-containing protein [Gordonia mangrovi]UVF80510.1 sugar ABC transporter ATP-binding protein [Gordonia mangrovi]